MPTVELLIRDQLLSYGLEIITAGGALQTVDTCYMAVPTLHIRVLILVSVWITHVGIRAV